MKLFSAEAYEGVDARMAVKDQRQCPECGSLLAKGSPGGLCAACVFQNTLDLDTSEAETGSLEAALNRHFGDYELIEEIARGGMGVVYHARQISLRREVALKLITLGAFASPENLRRFKAEAELAASLDHPNIVPIFEIGEHDAQPWFSMGLVRGETLAGKLEKGALEPIAAAKLLVKIARAVEFAHQHGILHRDLKPGNILLDENGEPHLTDFGLARLLHTDSTLTHTNAILGTPAYMAPEQARADVRNLTTAADVHALGAILYECLTGAPPYAGGTTLETIRQVLEREPRKPSQLNPAADGDIETICLKCLEKEPARRYASAAYLADDLQRWLEYKPIEARPAGLAYRAAKWVRRRPVIAGLAAAIAILFVAGTSGIAWQWRRADARSRDATQARAETQRENYFSTISLAQRYIAEGDILRARKLLLKTPAGLRNWEWGHLLSRCFEELASIPAPANAPAELAWSPDSKQVAIAAADEVRLWNLLETREAARVRGILPGSPPAYSADGSLLVAGEDGIRVLDPKTGSRVRTIGGSKPLFHAAAGNRVLILTRETAGVWDVQTGIHIANLIDPAPGAPFGFRSNAERIVSFPSGTPPGKAITIWDANTGGPVGAVPRDPSGSITTVLDDAAHIYAVLRTSGEIEVGTVGAPDSTRKLRLDPFFKPVSIAISPGGTVLFTLDADQSQRLWDTRTLREIIHLPARTYNIAFSPNDRYFAGWGGDRYVRLIDLHTGEELKRFQADSDDQPGFLFSPDSKLLAISSPRAPVTIWRVPSEPARFDYEEGFKKVALDRTGRVMASAHRSGAVTLWNLASGRLARTLSGHLQWALSTAFSRTEDLLATGSVDKTARLWNPATGQTLATLRHNAPVFSLAFTKDGKELITGDEAGIVHFWDVHSRREKSASQLQHGTVLAIATSRPGAVALSFMDGSVALWQPDKKEPRVLGRHDGAAPAVAFSPDGQFLLSGGSDKTIQVWDTGSGRLVKSVLARSQVFDLDFSPDGSRLAAATTGLRTGLDYPSIDLWNFPECREILTFKYDSGQITSVKFSPDGTRLVSGYDAAQRLGTPSFGFQLQSLPLRDADYPGAAADPLAARVQLAAAEIQRKQLMNAEPAALPPVDFAVARSVWPPRDPSAPSNCIDLTPGFNAFLNVPWRPLSGWGEFGDDLSSLKPGVARLGKTPFDVRGLIVSPPDDAVWQRLRIYRVAPAPVLVNRAASKLVFLHATTFPADRGTPVASYLVEFADGSREKINLEYGRQIQCWHPAPSESSGPSEAVVAWTGPVLSGNTRIPGILFSWTWTNPNPARVIHSIQLAGTEANCAPFLAALTCEP